eukprot:04803_6
MSNKTQKLANIANPGRFANKRNAFRVGLGFRVQGSGFRVGLGFWGLGFRSAWTSLQECTSAEATWISTHVLAEI